MLQLALVVAQHRTRNNALSGVQLSALSVALSKLSQFARRSKGLCTICLQYCISTSETPTMLADVSREHVFLKKNVPQFMQCYDISHYVTWCFVPTLTSNHFWWQRLVSQLLISNMCGPPARTTASVTLRDCRFQQSTRVTGWPRTR